MGQAASQVNMYPCALWSQGILKKQDSFVNEQKSVTVRMLVTLWDTAGMPHPLGVPPSGPTPMGPPPGGPPDAKRQRTGGLVLEPEEEFLAKYPGPSKVLHFLSHPHYTGCTVAQKSVLFFLLI